MNIQILSMEVLLDSSFIISCIKRKIDFIQNLNEMGFNPVVPREVLQELKDLKHKSPQEERKAIDIAILLFEKRKIKKSKVGGNTVDEGLISKGKNGIHIATLDRVIKREVPNKIVINNSKNSLEIERL